MSAPAPTYAPRPKESGHWYDPRTRQLVETVPYSKKGTSGPPDLRHARKLGLVPGQSTITKCAAAWGLENWKREQVLMAALTLPRRAGETDKQFIARVIEDSEAQGAADRAAGTAIHAAIQQHYTDGRFHPDPIMRAHVAGAHDMILQEWGPRTWCPERCVSHTLGYATKVDLCSVEPDPVILDFKSKDFSPDDVDGLSTYDDHAMQLAAGAVALAGPSDQEPLPNTRAAIVYVSRTHPGLSWPVEVVQADLHRGWEMFRLLLRFWQTKNRYDSRWTT